MIKYLLAHTDIRIVRWLLSFMAWAYVFLCKIKVRLGCVQCNHASYQQDLPLDENINDCKSKEDFNLLFKSLPKLCLICKKTF